MQKAEEGPQKGYQAISDQFNAENPVIFSDYPTQMQFKQKVANGYVQDLSRQAEGGSYALPYSRNHMGVFYNQTIFEENGVEVPTTWEEFLRYVKRCRRRGLRRWDCSARIRDE